jgi:hypothetical protein
VGVLGNFVDAVEGRAELTAEASDGLKSVELANAMVYSTWRGEAVTLPLDAVAYQEALEHAIASSRPRLRTIREAKVDMAKSYT